MSDTVKGIALVLVVVIGGLAAYLWLFRDSLDITVHDLHGEVHRVAEGGRDEVLSDGMALSERDRISVSEDGAAVLSWGAGSSLELSGGTTVELSEVRSDGIHVELEGGRVRAKVPLGDPRLGLTHDQRVVQATDAEFSVVASADGVLAIETTRGRVDVAGLDGVSSVAAGEKAIGGPSGVARVAPLNEELLLHVVWPEANEAAAAVVRGDTAPWSTVTVRAGDQEVHIAVGADGAFSADVPVHEGDNPVLIEAVDPLDHRRQEQGRLKRDTEAPTATKAAVVYGG